MTEVEFLPDDAAEKSFPPHDDEPRVDPALFRLAALLGWGAAVVLLLIAPFCATVLVQVPTSRGLRTGALADGWGRIGNVFRGGVHLDRFGIVLYVAAGLIAVAVAATVMRRMTIARIALIVAPSLLVGTAMTMALSLQTYVDEFAAAAARGQATSAGYGACMWLTVVAAVVAVAASILGFLADVRPRDVARS